ncbi:hypothetical protein ACPT9H_18230 [Brevibacillus borstelensis]|uniref:hypothetical protein n=1 Tax=Brevibacillus borstelensis TaxID=45462 RepID=UPI003CE598BE
MNAIREGFHTLKILKNCLDFLCHYKEKYDYEEEEQQSTSTIVSNYLEEGTKLFAIKDVDPSIHIAIEKDEGIFIKATEKNSVPKKQKTN